ncbi:hypothetical protein IWW55_005231 [Coemansia sp. RSA 2706]|nr:hypothetical protein LPJ63_000997 [Coemansia sp. RSA 2711]KAJ1849000.1 hypothetical protein LPJ70_000727 [Coemansia sp. RSA 2708]KAJ2296053.1 hypothetical protein IWW55_005231 [Coemansia sp. RSA 2706]KAJ2303306.1 hypothetical protein IWW54_005763 [Coemansia sp. RSA 2705]KAJ2309778.1 hypothetical protein IWW52_005598 [Coemansia sp. RSA 2704]KAJ2320350.1 hypothetical protein IWW51_004650 [Coemansia sp. RSA 2702]
MNINTSGAGSSLQQLHDTLTGSSFGQARSIPLSPDVVPGLDPGQALLVDDSDQYLKPIARSNTPSSMEDCSRRSSVSSNTSKLGNTFVNKLTEMVNDNQYQHLISWNFSGTSFVVCNIMEFSRELLPKHFKHNNFSSFVRQLNMYGFHKVNKSPRGHRTMAENQIWEFSHPKFIRDRPDLLDQIKRKTMESESLRREAGDLHANFVMLQVSHTDLVKRVHHLQENLSEVIRELAETRKKQATQEGILRQLLQALKQGGTAGASLPQDLDIEAAIASQSTRPSIFISDHDTNSLLHPELGYSASMSTLSTHLQLGSGGFIGGVSTSPSPASPISTIGQIGTALHHSASAQSLSIGAPQRPQPQVASPQQLRSALGSDSLSSDSLGVYSRHANASLSASQSGSSSSFYAAGTSNSLSTSSLSSTEIKDMYNR